MSRSWKHRRVLGIDFATNKCAVWVTRKFPLPREPRERDWNFRVTQICKLSHVTN